MLTCSGGIANLTDPTQVAELGRLIKNAVMINPSNSSEIRFNLMFPGAYAPFLQILAQTWSSIESMAWIRNEVISGAGRPDWPGDWPDYTTWLTYHNPAVSPLDSPTPMEYGSGPFSLVNGTLDYDKEFWYVTRYDGYFRGWPAGFPLIFDARPEGFVDTVNVTWASGWATSAMFMNGDGLHCGSKHLLSVNCTRAQLRPLTRQTIRGTVYAASTRCQNWRLTGCSSPSTLTRLLLSNSVPPARSTRTPFRRTSSATQHGAST